MTPPRMIDWSAGACEALGCLRPEPSLLPWGPGAAQAARVRKYLALAEPHPPTRCLRHHYSALAVRGDAVLFPSYNGAPRGSVNCDALGECNKSRYAVPVGGHGVPHRGDEYCPAVHAEENVICAAARLGVALEGSDLYISGRDPDGSVPDCSPCQGCAKLIRHAGFRLVVMDGRSRICVVTPAELAVVVAVHPELLQLGAPEHW